MATDYHRFPDGGVRIMRDDLAAKLGGRRATDAEVGASQRAALVTTTPSPAKPVEWNPPRVKWLGVEWIGKPWPTRIRLRSPFVVLQSPGCGCLRRLKAAFERATA